MPRRTAKRCASNFATLNHIKKTALKDTFFDGATYFQDCGLENIILDIDTSAIESGREAQSRDLRLLHHIISTWPH